MKSFTINLGNRPVQAEEQEDKTFIVKAPGGDMHLQLKQDAEGANHWFIVPGDNETAQSIEAGKAIEACWANG